MKIFNLIRELQSIEAQQIHATQVKTLINSYRGMMNCPQRIDSLIQAEHKLLAEYETYEKELKKRELQLINALLENPLGFSEIKDIEFHY
jgi:hypothetical protein